MDELDPPAWGPPDYNSHLVRTCHELRTKPLSQFTPENFRIMIGQRIALNQLVPRAIATLEANPLAEGDFGPGDLLRTVLIRPEPSYWQSHPDRPPALRSLANLESTCHTFHYGKPNGTSHSERGRGFGSVGRR